MNHLDDMAHVIQLSVAPVFLLTGVVTLLNVLSGRLSRIVDRARVLESQLDGSGAPSESVTLNELHVLDRRGNLIYRAITLSTFAALMVCLVIASLFAAGMLQYTNRLLLSGMFIMAMVASIASLIYFLREVFLAIQTFEVGLGRGEVAQRLSTPAPQANGIAKVASNCQ